MLITQQNLDLVFRGVKTLYRESFEQAPVHFTKVAMTVPSVSRDETHGWIGQFPNLRERIGPRHVQTLAASSFTIRDRRFGSTVEVDRDDIADDRVGLFKPVFQEMGLVARQHPDQLVFQLLAAGFTSNCYDGQFFFDTDHPVLNAGGEVVPVSNVQAGAGAGERGLRLLAVRLRLARAAHRGQPAAQGAIGEWWRRRRRASKDGPGQPADRHGLPGRTG